ncbi:MAG TPA: heavy metal-responsive transcriptional regulator [Chromatiaceae bacterium]|nr:heavy metal-responsive transcriptional regulator [Chromatiaceae bacterium]
MSISSSSSIKKSLRIGEVSRLTGLSVDTLRYYEKLGLFKPGRSSAGLRFYTKRDLSSLHFIRRAKSMNFSLNEIARLLEMRADPQHARNEVRALAIRKLAAVEEQLQQLDTLRRELNLLVNLCRGAEDGCPIIEDLENN